MKSRTEEAKLEAILNAGKLFQEGVFNYYQLEDFCSRVNNEYLNHEDYNKEKTEILGEE